MVPLHGLGGSADLPIPLPMALTGAVAALVLSFAILVLAWRKPRYPRPSARPAPAWLDHAWVTVTFRVAGLVVGGWVAWALFFGRDLIINPALGSFYVLLWTGVVPASLLFGRFWYAFSPVRTIALGLERQLGGGLWELPKWVGVWPAGVGLFAFVWQELVNPNAASVPSVRVWVLWYLVAMILGTVAFGSKWLSAADPFQVYSNLLARLSPWCRVDGKLSLRSPLANLAAASPQSGRTFVCAVLLGSTAYDSLSENLWWLNLTRDFPITGTAMGTLTLIGVIAIAAVTFAAGTRGMTGEFAITLVPIITGYMVAHYLSYFVEQGQVTLVQLSDPMSKGQDLLGTADWEINYWLSFHPTFLASVKVLAIVLGHVVAVISSHDKALSLLPKERNVTGQLPLLAVMVGYTYAGLALLMAA